MHRLYSATIVFLLVLVFASTGALAGESVDLDTALEKAEARLEAERAKLVSARAAREKERHSLVEKMETLRANVDKLEKKRLSLAKADEELETAVSKLRDTIKSADTETAALLLELKTIAEEIVKTDTSGLAGLLDPDIKEAREKLKGLLQAETTDPTALLSALFALRAAELSASRQIQSIASDVITPSGNVKPADILLLGRIGAVAKEKENGKLHMAWLAPGETIPGTASPGWGARRRLDETWDKLAGKETGVFTVPVDVTGNMVFQEEELKKSFWERLVSGGPVMIAIGLVAFIGFIITLERFWTLGRERILNRRFSDEVTAQCRIGEFEKAATRCKSTKVPAARILGKGIENRGASKNVIEDVLREGILTELPHIERFLAVLGVLAAVAPLLGLLGTVTGIIRTFDTITLFGTGNPRYMAGGISEALITTASGLIVAIPFLIIHSMLSSRADRETLELEKAAEALASIVASPGGTELSPVSTGREAENQDHKTPDPGVDNV